MSEYDATFPHCDSSVLHAPGECAYCDRHPEWQWLRGAWGIAFTGHVPEGGTQPCPSDARRGTGAAHSWPGNQPAPTYDHEHPCPSKHCIEALRSRGYEVPADEDCCVCFIRKQPPRNPDGSRGAQ